MSDLPSDSSPRSRWSDKKFEVMSGTRDVPEVLRDVPNDFPILGENDFGSAVVKKSEKKQMAKHSIHLP